VLVTTTISGFKACSSGKNDVAQAVAEVSIKAQPTAFSDASLKQATELSNLAFGRSIKYIVCHCLFFCLFGA
jgi:hypothetical protein